MSRVVALASLLLLPAVSYAEEGLAVLRFGGGAAAPLEDRTVAGALGLSADLCFSARFGLVFDTHFLARPGYRNLGLGLGLKAVPFEWFWRRIYVHLVPELQLSFGPPEDRADFGVRALVGYEELLFWGTGLFLETFAALPLTTERPLDAVAVGATAGLFIEF
ncbi:MAG: hypothetical protein HY791_07665 [Deltaproteobacteria bacterium]|nr:hypothetical protein [Deltaproteobacteria bacterium]